MPWTKGAPNKVGIYWMREPVRGSPDRYWNPVLVQIYVFFLDYMNGHQIPIKDAAEFLFSEQVVPPEV